MTNEDRTLDMGPLHKPCRRSARLRRLLGRLLCAVALLTPPVFGHERSGNQSGTPVLTPFAAYVTALAPVAWWRLGEIAGEAFADSAGPHTGQAACLQAPTPGQSGAVAGDPDTAIAISAPLQQCIEVPSHRDLSLGKAHDRCTRNVPAGMTWGTAAAGGVWQPSFTVSGSYYACDGSVALIDQTTTAATWGQTLAVERSDVDVQLTGAWDQGAIAAQIAPLGLVARYQDSDNYLRAELVERVGGDLVLRLVRTAGGQSQLLASTGVIGSYAPGAWWHLRFQLEGASLRARAWPADAVQPAAWQLDIDDAGLTAAGRVGVRSSNSGSGSRPTVSIASFRAQSVGMSVHVCVRPDLLVFPGQQDNYVHWFGKGQPGQHEWVFRFYSQNSSRPNRFSAYIFNLQGGLGAGAYVQEAVQVGVWQCLVAVFDPGDNLDLGAGVTLYKNGTRRQGPPSIGTFYSHPDYLVAPAHGAAPLRIGTRDSGSYLTGGIDEVQIYDRRLTAAEVAELYRRTLDQILSNGFE